MNTLSPKERGRYAEIRFLRVVRESLKGESWFIGVDRSSDKQDACGVDAVVTICRMDGKVVRVPVQLKSSFNGVKRHLVKYPDFWKNRVVYVLVNEHQTDQMICTQLLNELLHVRQGQYDYKAFFKEIAKSDIPSAVLRRMKRDRTQNPVTS